MGRCAIAVWQFLREALRKQRAGIVSALVVAVLLVGFFHAPAWPVLLGCAAALVILLASARRTQPGP